jgi:hypothetical protein
MEDRSWGESGGAGARASAHCLLFLSLCLLFCFDQGEEASSIASSRPPPPPPTWRCCSKLQHESKRAFRLDVPPLLLGFARQEKSEEAKGGSSISKREEGVVKRKKRRKSEEKKNSSSSRAQKNFVGVVETTNKNAFETPMSSSDPTLPQRLRHYYVAVGSQGDVLVRELERAREKQKTEASRKQNLSISIISSLPSIGSLPLSLKTFQKKKNSTTTTTSARAPRPARRARRRGSRRRPGRAGGFEGRPRRGRHGPGGGRLFGEGGPGQSPGAQAAAAAARGARRSGSRGNFEQAAASPAALLPSASHRRPPGPLRPFCRREV